MVFDDLTTSAGADSRVSEGEVDRSGNGTGGSKQCSETRRRGCEQSLDECGSSCWSTTSWTNPKGVSVAAAVAAAAATATGMEVAEVVVSMTVMVELVVVVVVVVMMMLTTTTMMVMVMEVARTA